MQNASITSISCVRQTLVVFHAHFKTLCMLDIYINSYIKSELLNIPYSHKPKSMKKMHNLCNFLFLGTFFPISESEEFSCKINFKKKSKIYSFFLCMFQI